MIDHDEVANLAASMLAFRRARTAELPPSLFGEPSWDFLLELFIADARGTRVTGRQISERHHISPAVASRWLKHLSAECLVVGDGSGDLDDELTLSGAAMAKNGTAAKTCQRHETRLSLIRSAEVPRRLALPQ